MGKSGTALAPEKSATPATLPIRHPSDMFRSLSQEMDRVFDEFGLTRRFPFFARTVTPDEPLWSPAVEIDERDGMLTVRADLPGLSKEDVKIDVTDEALTIEGERKETKEDKSEGYYRSERSYGHFYRSFALPDGARPDTAKATFDNGVLQIKMQVPTRKESTARRVLIEETPKG